MIGTKDIMEKRGTQPDQNNSKSKLKYVTNDTYHAPLFRNICEINSNSDNMYTTTGERIKHRMGQHSEFSKSNKGQIDVDDEFDEGLNNMYGDTMSQGIENTEMIESGRSKYINSSRKPLGSFNRGGFGKDLDRFAEIKAGKYSRKDDSISNTEMNRFHFTYRKYQDAHWGSFPEPVSTRIANKKVIS